LKRWIKVPDDEYIKFAAYKSWLKPVTEAAFIKYGSYSFTQQI